MRKFGNVLPADDRAGGDAFVPGGITRRQEVCQGGLNAVVSPFTTRELDLERLVEGVEFHHDFDAVLEKEPGHLRRDIGAVGEQLDFHPLAGDVSNHSLEIRVEHRFAAEHDDLERPQRLRLVDGVPDLIRC